MREAHDKNRRVSFHRSVNGDGYDVVEEDGSYVYGDDELFEQNLNSVQKA